MFLRESHILGFRIARAKIWCPRRFYLPNGNAKWCVGKRLKVSGCLRINGKRQFSEGSLFFGEILGFWKQPWGLGIKFFGEEKFAIRSS